VPLVTCGGDVRWRRAMTCRHHVPDLCRTASQRNSLRICFSPQMLCTEPATLSRPPGYLSQSRAADEANHLLVALHTLLTKADVQAVVQTLRSKFASNGPFTEVGAWLELQMHNGTLALDCAGCWSVSQVVAHLMRLMALQTQDLLDEYISEGAMHLASPAVLDHRSAHPASCGQLCT
jgi:hypothetical protein